MVAESIRTAFELAFHFLERRYGATGIGCRGDSLAPGGVVHGGIFATLLDTVAGYAAYTVAPKDADVLTIQLNLNMTATARLGERIIATAKAVHAGRRTAVVNGELRLPDGKLLVTGSGTFFFVDGGVV